MTLSCTRERAAALADLAPGAAGVVTGDLGSAAGTPDLAGQVNGIGQMDAGIHNAGVYLEPSRSADRRRSREDPRGEHPGRPACSRRWPAVRTGSSTSAADCITQEPGPSRDIDWTGRPWNAARACAETRLQVTALALARAWPQVLCNAVDPGWVPAKRGGAAATGDLHRGYLTQTWLAVSTDAAAVTGGYWYRRQRQEPAPQARDPASRTS